MRFVAVDTGNLKVEELTCVSFSSWFTEEEASTSSPAAYQAEAESPHAHLRSYHWREGSEGPRPQQTGHSSRRWLPHPAAVQEGGYAYADDAHDRGTSTSDSLRSPCTKCFHSRVIVRPQLGPKCILWWTLF